MEIQGEDKVVLPHPVHDSSNLWLPGVSWQLLAKVSPVREASVQILVPSIVPGLPHKPIWVERGYEVYFHPFQQAGYARLIVILLTQGPKEDTLLFTT